MHYNFEKCNYQATINAHTLRFAKLFQHLIWPHLVYSNCPNLDTNPITTCTYHPKKFSLCKVLRPGPGDCVSIWYFVRGAFNFSQLSHCALRFGTQFIKRESSCRRTAFPRCTARWVCVGTRPVERSIRWGSLALIGSCPGTSLALIMRITVQNRQLPPSRTRCNPAAEKKGFPRREAGLETVGCQPEPSPVAACWAARVPVLENRIETNRMEWNQIKQKLKSTLSLLKCAWSPVVRRQDTPTTQPAALAVTVSLLVLIDMQVNVQPSATCQSKSAFRTQPASLTPHYQHHPCLITGCGLLTTHTHSPCSCRFCPLFYCRIFLPIFSSFIMINRSLGQPAVFGR